MNKPLKGIKVIELASHGAVPSCGKTLADWGAEVIKVEPLSGDFGRKSGQNFGVPMSEDVNPHFELLNGNKKSICLNLKNPEGYKILMKILEKADVLITNYRQAALDKLVLDYNTLHDKFPELIFGHLSGFGTEGPIASQPGFDTVSYFARTGFLIDFAEKDTSPINAPFGVGDLTAGGTLAGAIGTALFNRERTGEGEKVEISLYGQSIWGLGIVLQSVKHGVDYPKTRKEATVPLNNCYQCRDGEWIYISVLEYDRYCNKLFKLIGHEELCEDERFNNASGGEANNKELIEILDEGFKRYNRDEWKRLLEEADIAFDYVNHMKDVINDEQALANDFIINLECSNGLETVIAQPPVRFGESKVSEHVKAPKLGEQSEEILASIGYKKEEIDLLVAKEITLVR